MSQRYAPRLLSSLQRKVHSLLLFAKVLGVRDKCGKTPSIERKISGIIYYYFWVDIFPAELPYAFLLNKGVESLGVIPSDSNYMRQCSIFICNLKILYTL